MKNNSMILRGSQKTLNESFLVKRIEGINYKSHKIFVNSMNNLKRPIDRRILTQNKDIQNVCKTPVTEHGSE